MRNLKKMLSLVMALAMVASFMVVGASASFTDEKDIKNVDAVNMLVALGVIKGRDTGSFDPNGTVTRAEMAKMLCVVMNGGKDPNLSGVGSFPDTKTHWAAGYIEYCKNLRIVAGSTDGNFYPDKTVTGTEAAKMILMALGYDAVNEKFSNDANWETNINVAAGVKGLYNGVAVVPSQGLSRDNAAQMIYNGLEAKMVSYRMVGIVDGNGVSQSYDLDKTLLADKFGVITVEGIVVANEYASLTSASADAKKDAGETQIAVTGEEGISGTYKVPTTLDMLGQSVTLYIKYKNAGSDKDATVFGVPTLSSSNKIVVTTDGSNPTDAAEDNDISMASNAQYFKNFAKVTNLDDVKQGGKLTLIDNDNDDEAEYAIYVEYTAGAVTAKNTADDGYLTINGLGKIEKSKNIVGFEDVAKGDYVLAVQYGGKTYVEKPETVTGVLEAYSVSKATAKIDGTTYDMAETPNNVANTDPELTDTIQGYVTSAGVLDVEATFYLDVNGCVLAVGQPEDANLQFAVILAGEKSGFDTARAKLLLSDGTIARYDVDKMDGETPDGTAGAPDITKAGTIVSYTENKDGSLKLTTKGDAATGAAAFEKGKVRLTVGSKSYTITNDTVFLYYDNDKVSRFVGKGNAPDLTTSGTTVSVATRGGSSTVASVVYVNQKAEGSFDGNYIYLYDAKVTANSDGYEVTAVVNGEKKSVTIDNFASGDLKSTTLLKDTTLGLYAFSVEDDIYSLSAKSADADGNVVIEDTVSEVGRDYVLVANGVGNPAKKEFVLNNDTITVSVEDKKLTTGVSISDTDTVTLVFNDDDEVLYAFITKHTETSSGGSISAAIDSIVLGSGTASGKLDLVVTLKEVLAANNSAAISVQLERSVDDGKTWRAVGNVDKTGTIAAQADPAAETVSLNAPASDTNLYRAVVTVTVTDTKGTAETTDDVVVEIATNFVTNEALSF